MKTPKIIYSTQFDCSYSIAVEPQLAAILVLPIKDNEFTGENFYLPYDLIKALARIVSEAEKK